MLRCAVSVNDNSFCAGLISLEFDFKEISNSIFHGI